jgi:hypothetical protein
MPIALTKDPARRIAFLFGAGLSQSAGMPGTDCLTEAVRRGSWGQLTACKCDYPAHRSKYTLLSQSTSSRIDQAAEVDHVRTFLDRLVEAARPHNPRSATFSYEELYSLSYQLNQHIRGRFINPALNPFVRAVECAYEAGGECKRHTDPQLDADAGTALHLDNNENDTHKSTHYPSVGDLAGDAWEFIRDLVGNILALECANHSLALENGAIHWIVDALRSEEVTVEVIVTLNYDTLVECLLSENAVPFQDVFCALDPNTVTLGQQSLPPATGAPHLLKLHGSLNWFWRHKKLERLEPGADLMRRPHRDGPLILLGTTNKVWDYYAVLYDTLQREFFSLLQRVSTVIVCGYSFGDYVVNLRLWDWLRRERQNRLLIVHKDGEELIGGPHSGLTERLKRMFLEFGSQLDYEPSFAEGTSWKRISQRILRVQT